MQLYVLICTFVLLFIISTGFTYSHIYADTISANQGKVNTSKLTGSGSAPHFPGDIQGKVDTSGKIIQCVGGLLLHKAVCTGTNKDDIIVESISGGTIYGLDGDDKFQGRLGSEVAFGGNGNDVIRGGNGSSTLFGNDGDDTIIGGGGPNNRLGGGTSFLYGGDGNDKLIGGFDHEVMVGGSGHNTFICDGKQDLILDFDSSKDVMQGNCILL